MSRGLSPSLWSSGENNSLEPRTGKNKCITLIRYSQREAGDWEQKIQGMFGRFSHQVFILYEYEGGRILVTLPKS